MDISNQKCLFWHSTLKSYLLRDLINTTVALVDDEKTSQALGESQLPRVSVRKNIVTIEMSVYIVIAAKLIA